MNYQQITNYPHDAVSDCRIAIYYHCITFIGYNWIINFNIK